MNPNLSVVRAVKCHMTDRSAYRMKSREAIQPISSTNLISTAPWSGDLPEISGALVCRSAKQTQYRKGPCEASQKTLARKVAQWNNTKDVGFRALSLLMGLRSTGCALSLSAQEHDSKRQDANGTELHEDKRGEASYCSAHIYKPTFSPTDMLTAC